MPILIIITQRNIHLKVSERQNTVSGDEINILITRLSISEQRRSSFYRQIWSLHFAPSWNIFVITWNRGNRTIAYKTGSAEVLAIV